VRGGIEYWQGQAVRLRVVFTGDGGAPETVTGVSFRVRKPDLTLVTVAASADPAQPGAWIGQVVADQVGTWTAKASCSGPSPAVDQSEFVVKQALTS
jgi:hypothetical protein